MKKIEDRRQPNLLAGAVVGLAAGLGAAFVMEAFQNKLSALREKAKSDGSEDDVSSGGEPDSEPATEKAADRVSQAVTGQPTPKPYKQQAGRAVHYATGAALGLAYGVLAEISDGVTTGFGMLFGTGVALAVDEGLVPLLGLSASAQQTPPADHLVSLGSHWVYGATLEGLRRLLRVIT